MTGGKDREAKGLVLYPHVEAENLEVYVSCRVPHCIVWGLNPIPGSPAWNNRAKNKCPHSSWLKISGKPVYQREMWVCYKPRHPLKESEHKVSLQPHMLDCAGRGRVDWSGLELHEDRLGCVASGTAEGGSTSISVLSPSPTLRTDAICPGSSTPLQTVSAWGDCTSAHPPATCCLTLPISHTV